MLASLVPHATSTIVTKPENPRAMAAGELAAVVRRVAPAVTPTIVPASIPAIDLALSRSPVICVAGSIFLVGEVIAELERRARA